jgi:hypothetical protein
MRAVVDCLPYETKVAMLEGLDRYEIIAGAYSDRSGGVCPMLAAHRCGGRTDFRSFARAWDRFTGAGRARRANKRELHTLRAQLEQSVWAEEQTRSKLLAQPAKREPGVAATKTAPLRERRTMGAWLIPFRDWDGYRVAIDAALRQFDEEMPFEQADAELAASRGHAPVVR